MKVSPLTVPRATTCEPTTTSLLVAAFLAERVDGRAVDGDDPRLVAATGREGQRGRADRGDLAGRLRRRDVDRGDRVGAVVVALLAERDLVAEVQVADGRGLAALGDLRVGGDDDRPRPAIRGLEAQLRAGDPGDRDAAEAAPAALALRPIGLGGVRLRGRLRRERRRGRGRRGRCRRLGRGAGLGRRRSRCRGVSRCRCRRARVVRARGGRGRREDGDGDQDGEHEEDGHPQSEGPGSADPSLGFGHGWSSRWSIGGAGSERRKRTPARSSSTLAFRCGVVRLVRPIWWCIGCITRSPVTG